MLRRKRADTYVYRLYCDLCGHEMKAGGPQPQPMKSRQPEVIHRCTNEHCANTLTITGKAYPAIDYVEIQEEAADTVPTPEQPEAG